MERRYELADGRLLPVAAEHRGHDYAAYVLHDVEAAHEWLLTWTDGINCWLEEWFTPEVAYARLAALVRACDQGTFMVHDPSNRGGHEGRVFADEAERFLARVVHASDRAPGCDGTDPVPHRG